MTKFDLVFADRDDGTKVWSAKCHGCESVIVGERSPQVVVLRAEMLTVFEFDRLKIMIREAWDAARKSGYPIAIPDPRIKLESVVDHGDLQRALEAHAGACPKRKPPRPEPTSMPGPGEPR